MFKILPTSVDDFYRSILIRSLDALKSNHLTDNFDARRFNIDGRDHSMEFDAPQRAFNFHWFFNSVQPLYSAYSLLGDEHSRRLFLHLIAYRLAGHLSVKIPVGFNSDPVALAEYRSAENASAMQSSLSVPGVLGDIKHLDFNYRGSRYVVDCLRLESCLFRGQYFYDRDGVRIAPEAGDHAIDGGAFLGDTACVFSNAVGREGKVYSFDPVANHLDVLEYNIRQFPIKNVMAFPLGLSNQNVFSNPVILNSYAPGFSSIHGNVPTRSIDHLANANEIERVDFLKLDVEGAELAALDGARNTINRFKPKLAISLYHKSNDLFEIPLYIRQNFPFYSCHIDHYTIHMEETVLYCKCS